MSRRSSNLNDTLLRRARRRVAAAAAAPARLFSLAPRRGLTCPCPPVPCSPGELQDEAALLAHAQQVCLEHCARCFHQPEVYACQEVCPEAFSQIAPPERCWLLSLRETDPAGAADPGEVTGLVALQGHDLCILLW